MLRAKRLAPDFVHCAAPLYSPQRSFVPSHVLSSFGCVAIVNRISEWRRSLLGFRAHPLKWRGASWVTPLLTGAVSPSS